MLLLRLEVESSPCTLSIDANAADIIIRTISAAKTNTTMIFIRAITADNAVVWEHRFLATSAVTAVLSLLPWL